MASNTRTVLITGVGAPGIRGTLYALRHNPDGVAVRTIGTDTRADAVGRWLVDGFHEVPAPEDPSYLQALLAICRSEEVEVVIPQTTREIAVLCHHKSAFRQAGVPVMVSEPGPTEIANSKFRLMEVFRRLGLPCPAYHLATTEREVTDAAHRLGYPERSVVVKPPVSNGMRGVRILKEGAWDVRRFLEEKPSGLEISLSELLSILRRGDPWPELLVMEYLPGPEYSVDACIAGETRIVVPRLRKAIRSGISFENSLEYRDDLVQYTLNAAVQIGLQYAFGFQFKLDSNNVPKVLECNPRVQGTMVASVFSGVNVIWLAVKALLGEAVDATPAALQPACFYRFWGGLGVVGDTVYEI